MVRQRDASESLFQKDLDIDPFIASSPEEIQAEYDDMQESFQDKYSGNFLEICWRRFKNINTGSVVVDSSRARVERGRRGI